MNKQDRYNLIRAISTKTVAVPLAPASKHDVKEEIALAKSHDDDNSIINSDEETPFASKAMVSSVEKISRVREKDSDSILSKAEREQARRELEESRWARYRKFALALPMKPLVFA